MADQHGQASQAQASQPLDHQPQDYQVRRLTAQDAEAIPALTLRVNGPLYAHSEVFHPERLLELNQQGQLLSVVALYRQTEVVGHLALERPDLEPFAESGEAMVLPEHQHHHLLEEMRRQAEAEAQRLDLAGVFGEAVTHHVYSQRAEEHFAAVPTGIKLGAVPAASHQLDNYPQRLSLLCFFKYLNPATAPRIHLPTRHRELAERIFGRLGRHIEFGEPGSAAQAGRIETSYTSAKQQGLIKVLHAGTQTARQVTAAAGAMRQDGAEVVFVQIPLAQPPAAALCEELEQHGFFISGIDPRGREFPDLLRMQTISTPLDLALIQIDGEFSREVVNYVARERERVSQSSR